jgi:hypothetical protein
MDKSLCLVIAERRGCYPGMKTILNQDIFFVRKNWACGEAHSWSIRESQLVIDFSFERNAAKI